MPAMIKTDEIGPECFLQVSDAQTGLLAFLCIDNTNLGPGKGGIRLAQNVSGEEVFRLARAMTWKNALAELPFGGAKSGIDVGNRNPHDAAQVNKDALIRAFARRVKQLVPEKYVAGPDMNTTEVEMDAFADEVGTPKACTGKSKAKGGLPHELGSTGFGVAKSTLSCLEEMRIAPENATVAIEGFGNVGTFAAKFLSEAGCRVVCVSDSKGAVYDERGLDFERLLQTKQEKKTVVAYESASAKKLEATALFGLPVTVLIPGARPDAINESNKNAVKCKLLVEAANIPVGEEIEEELWRRGIVFVPDVIANAGGVISSYCEFVGKSEQEMFRLVEEKIVRNTRLVMEEALRTKKNPREIARRIARERVTAAGKKK
ncbi:MAG: Glu/Leu/Phe/Val dehydrogenase [Candidatus Norongarragalinales archaeon]